MIFNVTRMVIRGIIDIILYDDRPLDRPSFKYKDVYYSLDKDIWLVVRV
jgi:hypothetical protein